MSSPAPTIAMFADHLRFNNPFDENRVNQTDVLRNDVSLIHDDAFQKLIGHARIAANSKDLGRGVVVSGPAGIGKSHLLARFGEWARDERYPFIYLLNLQAGPNDILKTILRTSISILTKGLKRSPGETRLFKMVSATIKEALNRQKVSPPIELGKARYAYEKMLNDLDHDGSIYDVLWLFFEDVFNRTNGKPADGRAELAKTWLSGGYLDPDDARRLEMSVSNQFDDGCSLDVEGMKEVLKVLCQFAGYRERSFILCFDQVDTLSGDQVQSWSATVHALLDICPRLLVVTSGVDHNFMEWPKQNLVSHASWQRIRQFSIDLKGINADAARVVIRDRLKASLAPFQPIRDVQNFCQRDDLFPLGQAWAQTTLFEANHEKIDLVPREIINRAGSAWNRECEQLVENGPAKWLNSWPTPGPVPPPPLDLTELIDQKVHAKINEHRQNRLLNEEGLPVDSGNVVGLLQSMLSGCQQASDEYRSRNYPRFGGFSLAIQKGTSKPPFQLTVEHLPEGPDGIRRKIGVAVAEASSGLAATNMLKRILAQLDGANPPDRAVLVVDNRERLKLAKVGQLHLNELNSRTGKFALQELDIDQYATLDAYQGVIGMARNGDLDAVLPDGSGRPITELEVQESHHRNRRYLTPSVLCQLVGTCDPIGPDPGDCNQIDPQQLREATYAQLALNLGLTTIQLTSWWIEHQQPKPAEVCRSVVHGLFKDVVLQLHDEGRVFATAVNDYYMVLPTQKFMEPQN